MEGGHLDAFLVGLALHGWGQRDMPDLGTGSDSPGICFA